MARELAISIYLFVFRILFDMFKLFPQKKKTVCVSSFGDNIFYTARALKRMSDDTIVILENKRCSYPFDAVADKQLAFDWKHPAAFFLSIYHLATASTVLVDNYYGFLAVTDFRENVKCVQLWHAAGAIKQFGLNDPSIAQRDKRAKNRFRKVYQRFDYTVSGSEKMAAIFRDSFGVSDQSILRTGIPRTDLFYNETEKKQIIEQLRADFPGIGDRKVLLYAPTYRDHQLHDYQLQLDVKQLYRELSSEYVLFIKMHPAVQYTMDANYDDFVYDVSNYYDANHLLLITDLLITDYSSIPFEYALMHKPVIFYAYDLEEYNNTRGVFGNYYESPGPVVHTTEALLAAIKQSKFDLSSVRKFASVWNEYSTGHASRNLAAFLTGKTEREKVSVQ